VVGGWGGGGGGGGEEWYSRQGQPSPTADKMNTYFRRVCFAALRNP